MQQYDDLGIEMAALEKSARLSSLLIGPIHEGIVEHLPQRAICNRTVRECHLDVRK